MDDRKISDLNTQLSRLLNDAQGNEEMIRLQQQFGELSELALFGAGDLGLHTIRKLASAGIVPLAVADNNPSRWGQNCGGVRVISPDELKQRYGSSIPIVVTIYNGSQVRSQLEQAGFTRVLAFTWFYRGRPDLFLQHEPPGRPEDIRAARHQIQSVFELLGDQESRQELVDQIRWRLSSEMDYLPRTHLPEEMYFPSDIFETGPSESFCDCGAFSGDTIQQFARHAKGEFQKIWALEPDPANHGRLCEYLDTSLRERRSSIQAIQTAVGKKDGMIRFEATSSAGSSVGASGNMEVPLACLDSLIGPATCTMVKMDIEGAEGDALEGAQKLMARGETIWAICLYHAPYHLWQIPLAFLPFSDRYRFFLRRYAEDCWELVFYAVPIHRLLK